MRLNTQQFGNTSCKHTKVVSVLRRNRGASQRKPQFCYKTWTAEGAGGGDQCSQRVPPRNVPRLMEKASDFWSSDCNADATRSVTFPQGICVFFSERNKRKNLLVASNVNWVISFCFYLQHPLHSSCESSEPETESFWSQSLRWREGAAKTPSGVTSTSVLVSLQALSPSFVSVNCQESQRINKESNSDASLFPHNKGRHF